MQALQHSCRSVLRRPSCIWCKKLHGSVQFKMLSSAQRHMPRLQPCRGLHKTKHALIGSFDSPALTSTMGLSRHSLTGDLKTRLVKQNRLLDNSLLVPANIFKNPIHYHADSLPILHFPSLRDNVSSCPIANSKPSEVCTRSAGKRRRSSQR